MTLKTLSALISVSLTLAACAPSEPPREAATVSSANTATLLPPKIKKMSADGIQITYPQISMGFDASCGAFRVMSTKLNQCAKLPENVKQLAVDHCSRFEKTAMFKGNKTNLIQMTVSHFDCE
jgi:hypothetical protein